MASSAHWYNKGLFEVFKQNLNLETDDIRVLLVSPTYVYDPTHNFVADITNEVTNSVGTGYARKTAGGLAITEDDDNDKLNIDCNDLSYTAINTAESIRGAIFYKFGTNDADSPLVAYHQGEILVTNGSDLVVAVDVDGLSDIINVQ